MQNVQVTPRVSLDMNVQTNKIVFPYTIRKSKWPFKITIVSHHLYEKTKKKFFIKLLVYSLYLLDLILESRVGLRRVALVAAVGLKFSDVLRRFFPVSDNRKAAQNRLLY